MRCQSKLEHKEVNDTQRIIELACAGHWLAKKPRNATSNDPGSVAGQMWRCCGATMMRALGMQSRAVSVGMAK